MINRIKSILLGIPAAFLLLAACTPSGVQDQPTPRPTEPITTATIPAESTTTTASLDEFITELTLAISSRDFTAMERMMSDPFTTGYWLSEWVEISPQEAAALFEDDFLPEGAQIAWADPELDLAPLLEGRSPSEVMEPNGELAATLLTYGWGREGVDEAILYITRQSDGTYRWEKVLYSSLAFPGALTETREVAIVADEAILYSGPGESSDQVATAQGGATYPVLGLSPDNQWRRLRCFDENDVVILACWVSADPAVTSPIAPETSPGG